MRNATALAKALFSRFQFDVATPTGVAKVAGLRPGETYLTWWQRRCKESAQRSGLLGMLRKPQQPNSHPDTAPATSSSTDGAVPGLGLAVPAISSSTAVLHAETTRKGIVTVTHSLQVAPSKQLGVGSTTPAVHMSTWTPQLPSLPTASMAIREQASSSHIEVDAERDREWAERAIRFNGGTLPSAPPTTTRTACSSGNRPSSSTKGVKRKASTSAPDARAASAQKPLSAFWSRPSPGGSSSG
jgi:hypothetical protein